MTTFQYRLLRPVCLTAILVCAAPVVAQAPTDQQPPAEADPSVLTEAAGAPTIDPAAETENPWQIEWNSWVWMIGIKGDLGIGNRSVDIDASFSDIIDESDSVLAFSGRLEFGKGRWGAFIDGLYADLGADDQSGSLGLIEFDVNVEMLILDFGVMYRVGEWEPTGDAANNPRNTTLDLYAGGRYTDLEATIDPVGLPSASRSVEWVDPIVGAKVVIPLAAQWRIQANGDIGGFGVGSDFTWGGTAVLGFNFSLFDHPMDLYVGYRAISQDYTDDSGARDFEWDVMLHGPIFGFSLLF